MKQIKNNHTKRLAINALMLYALTFSNYLLYFITIPYQTRVLGPETFGKVGFAMSFGIYVQLLLDFGFVLSATELIAKHSHDKSRVSSILSAVTWCKLLLSGISFLAVSLLCIFFDPFRQDPILYLFFFINSVVISFIPDFIYRGMENMRAITIRTVGIRVLFVLMVFGFLKNESDYYAIPVLNVIGNFVALALVALHMRSLHVRLVKVTFKELKSTMKESAMFFYSRVATNIYSATNIFILGLLYGPVSQIVGYYAATDKLVTASKQGATPIVDSLYPYMIRHRNFKLIKRILFVGLPIIGILCLITSFYTEQVCSIIFGEQFRPAGEYLRLLMPVIFVSLPTMLLGFPILAPMGLSKYANISTIFGACLQIIQICLLLLSGNLTATTICLATCFTEISTLTFRVVVIWRNRHLARSENE